MSVVEAAASGWFAWTGGVLWQSALLVALAWGVERVADGALGRGGWARVRLAMWAIVGLKLVIGPWVWSPVSVAAWVGRPEAAPIFGADGAIAASGVSAWGMALFGVWVFGVLAFGGLALRRWASVARIVRGGSLDGVEGARVRRAAGEAARRVGLEARFRAGRVRLTLLCMPGVFVCGVRRPVVALGRGDAARMSDRELVHAIMHELMHVRRRDGFLCTGATVLRVLYWFDPLVWYAGRRARALAEIGCDRDVARVLGEASGYRRTLALAAARGAGLRPAGAAALAMASGRGVITERLAALERGVVGSVWRGRLGAGSAGLLAAVCVAPMGIGPAALESSGVLDRTAAMQTVEAAVRGDGDVGCLRVRYAAMAMASSDPTMHGEKR